MSSSKKQKLIAWTSSLRFKKQSLAGKIILFITILLFGSFVIFNFFVLIVGRWNELGIYSIWIFFGWLFLIVLIYISVKLISMVMHRGNIEIQKMENKEKLNDGIKSEHHEEVKNNDA